MRTSLAVKTGVRNKTVDSCVIVLMCRAPEHQFQMRKLVFWVFSVCGCCVIFNILILNNRLRDHTQNSLVLVQQIVIGEGDREAGTQLRVGLKGWSIELEIWVQRLHIDIVNDR